MFNLFKPLTQLTIQELIKPLEVNFNNQFDQLSANIKVLKSELMIKNQFDTDLETCNKKLGTKITTLESNIDDLEQYSRRENLIFTGVPLSYSEAIASSTKKDDQVTVDKIMKLCQKNLNITIHSENIATAHPLKGSNSSRNPSAILVHFVRRSVHDNVFHANSLHKDFNQFCTDTTSRIFINEDLTDKRCKLLADAHVKFKSNILQSVGTSGCQIKIKTLTCNKATLRFMAELSQLADNT